MNNGEVNFNPFKGARARLTRNSIDYSALGLCRSPKTDFVSPSILDKFVACIYCGRAVLGTATAKQAEHVIAHIIADECTYACKYCHVDFTLPDSLRKLVIHLESAHHTDLVRELRLIPEDSLNRALASFYEPRQEVARLVSLSPPGRALSCRLCREIVFIVDRLAVTSHVIAHLDPTESNPLGSAIIYSCLGCSNKPIGDQSVILEHLMLTPEHKGIPFEELVSLEEARKLNSLIANCVVDCFGAKYNAGILCLLGVIKPVTKIHSVLPKDLVRRNFPGNCFSPYSRRRKPRPVVAAPSNSYSIMQVMPPSACSTQIFVDDSEDSAVIRPRTSPPVDAVSAEDIMGDLSASPAASPRPIGSPGVVASPGIPDILGRLKRKSAAAVNDSKEIGSKKTAVVTLTIPRVNAARTKAQIQQKFVPTDDNGEIEWPERGMKSSTADVRTPRDDLNVPLSLATSPVSAAESQQSSTNPSELMQKDHSWSDSPDVQEKFNDLPDSPAEMNANVSADSPVSVKAQNDSPKRLSDSPIIKANESTKSPKLPDIQAQWGDQLSKSPEKKMLESLESRKLPDIQVKLSEQVVEAPDSSTTAVLDDQERPESTCSLIEIDDSEFGLITCCNDEDFLTN